MRGYQIFVKGFTKQTTKQDLQQIFQKFGTVKQIKLIKSYAFVQFANQQSAKAACQQADDINIKGNKLKIQIAGGFKNKNKIKDNTCRNCGKQGHWYVYFNSGGKIVFKKPSKNIILDKKNGITIDKDKDQIKNKNKIKIKDLIQNRVIIIEIKEEKKINIVKEDKDHDLDLDILHPLQIEVQEALLLHILHQVIQNDINIYSQSISYIQFNILFKRFYQYFFIEF